MSSILEALKKVEKESPQLDFNPDFTRGMDARKAVSRRARTTRIVYRAVVSMVVLVVLGLGVWFALAHKDLFQKSTSDHNQPSVATKEALVTASVPSAEIPAIEKTMETPKEKPTPAPDVNGIKAGEQETHAPKPIPKEELVSIQPSNERLENHPDGAKFKLEAIGWAESPESRFAVMNGQILRTGGSMEGISVTAIAKDYVAVRSSGREWKLMFVAE